MITRKYVILVAVSALVISMIWMGASYSNSVSDSSTSLDFSNKQYAISEVANIIGNGGFETGSFIPWINLGSTSYNQIQTDRVYSGTYSLFMDSHYGDPLYEPVYQEIDTSISLDEAPLFSAALYPTKVGVTAGQAGVDHFTIRIINTATEEERNIYYLWSGYTYPGNDMNMNITKVMYLLFDLIPNQWNIVERNVLNDYISFYGSPEDVSDLEVMKVSMLAHSSNGDPGDFWVDDIAFNYDTSTTITTSETSTTMTETSDSSTTTETSTTPGDFEWLTIVISGGSGGVIIIVVIVIILHRRGQSGEYVPSGYQW